MTNTVLQGLLAGLVVILAAIVGYSMVPSVQPHNAFGSVAVSNEYQRVNLATSAAYGATSTPQRSGITGNLKTGVGALGSVVITGAAAGAMNFYDATTSDVTRRTGNTPTSTILLASLPLSVAAGTYTFDVEFRTGLIVDLVGVQPTTTVTFR